MPCSPQYTTAPGEQDICGEPEELHREIYAIQEERTFARGFRMGARLMLELLSGE